MLSVLCTSVFLAITRCRHKHHSLLRPHPSPARSAAGRAFARAQSHAVSGGRMEYQNHQNRPSEDMTERPQLKRWRAPGRATSATFSGSKILDNCQMTMSTSLN